MTNNLVEDPVFVDTVEEFDKQPKFSHIQFICKSCGKVTSLVIQTGKRRQNQRRLLCKSCGIKETCYTKYGVSNVMKDKETLEKLKQNFFEKFGVDNPQKLEKVRRKTKETNLKKYGNTCSLFGKDVIEKSNKTRIERFGTTYCLGNPKVREKSKQTSIKHFGVDHPSKSKTIKDKIRKHLRKKYLYNGIAFDSGWELVLYIYLTDKNISFDYQSGDSFEYVYDNVVHQYYPDFKIDGKFYEIKGKQFFNKDGTMCNPFDHSLDGIAEAKHKCMIDNNITILVEKDILPLINYVNEKYGESYIKSFLLEKDN